MLCPKCKFISFDHLSVCGKCHSDLTAVGQALRGTSANIQHVMFLGSALKSAESESLAEERFVDDGDVLLAGEGEPPALEFDESEIPHVDIPVSEVDSEEIFLSVPEEQPLAEEVPLAVGREESGEGEPEAIVLQEVEAVGGSDTSTLDDIDESDLALDTVGQESQPVTESPARDNLQGQMTLDLDEIDLSDLTNFPEGESDDMQAGVQGNADEEGFDDTMDLSLLVGVGSDEDLGAIDEDSKLSDLSPIDLTLVDDALVEMTVDHGPGGRARENSGKDGGIQLSMEDEEK